jgi:hypothetical protein
MLGCTTGLLFLLVWPGALGQSRSGEEYVRLSTPKTLTFEELVELEKTDEPSEQLAARLDQLLHTTVLLGRIIETSHASSPKRSK